MQKMNAFYHDKDWFVHYQTWPTFVHTNLKMQNSIDTLRQVKTFWRKLEKKLLVVFSSFLHAMWLLVKLLFDNLMTNANQLLRLTLANLVLIRCVEPRPSVCKRVGISIHRQVDSQLNQTIPVALKITPFLFSKNKTRWQNRELPYNRRTRKRTASVLVVFTPIATLYSKPVDLSSCLSLQRCSKVSHWGRYSTW